MKLHLSMLALTIAPTLLVQGCQNCEICTIPEDPIGYDPKLEVAHLYKDQWPTGIAMTSCGRKFSCYSAGIDALNTNNGCNGKHAVAELTECGEVACPNFNMNNPPRGVIDYSTSPPRTRGLKEYFISVKALFYDNDCNCLYCMDAGRARDENQILYEASPGGTKIVVINTCSDCIVETNLFPSSIAKPNSYFISLAVDTKKKIAYIADGLGYAINVLDLCSGKSWVGFQGDYTLTGVSGGLPFIWGQPSYGTATTPLGNTTVGSIRFGVSMVTLSKDRQKVYYSKLAGRELYSVSTAALLNPLSPSSVENHGERGVSLGIFSDKRGIVWSGSGENNGISFYNPTCKFAKTYLYIRDRRISWAYSFIEPRDGYLYFINNVLNGLPLVYSGTGKLYEDRRRKPYVLFRFKLPCDALCPSYCDPATLGLQVCPCGCCS